MRPEFLVKYGAELHWELAEDVRLRDPDLVLSFEEMKSSVHDAIDHLDLTELTGKKKKNKRTRKQQESKTSSSSTAEPELGELLSLTSLLSCFSLGREGCC